MDNWYTSSILLGKLYQEETGACGTVRTNRKYSLLFPVVTEGEIVRKCTPQKI